MSCLHLSYPSALLVTINPCPSEITSLTLSICRYMYKVNCCRLSWSVQETCSTSQKISFLQMVPDHGVYTVSEVLQVLRVAEIQATLNRAGLQCQQSYLTDVIRQVDCFIVYPLMQSVSSQWRHVTRSNEFFLPGVSF